MGTNPSFDSINLYWSSVNVLALAVTDGSATAVLLFFFVLFTASAGSCSFSIFFFYFGFYSSVAQVERANKRSRSQRRASQSRHQLGSSRPPGFVAPLPVPALSQLLFEKKQTTHTQVPIRFRLVSSVCRSLRWRRWKTESVLVWFSTDFVASCACACYGRGTVKVDRSGGPSSSLFAKRKEKNQKKREIVKKKEKNPFFCCWPTTKGVGLFSFSFGAVGTWRRIDHVDVRKPNPLAGTASEMPSVNKKSFVTVSRVRFFLPK